jgi:tRNA A-37 threonylcarbamoyl transferase component Bud32/tetratricopeptide (TPR) repeat protein
MEQPPTGPPSLLGGRYQLLRELGRGGTATVYLANDLQHNREVAVKILHPALARMLGPERFLREIRIAARLNHPNILPLHDSGEADGYLYYVMPFAAGDTLRQKMSREGQLRVEETLGIACDVADGLAYAHEHGVVHRDIKPENILLEGGRAVVADFGIARALSGTEMSISSSGLAVGTPGYMSPEQSSAGKDVDARSDVYSLGCVLYEMLAGEQLFAGPTAHAVASRHLHEQVPSLKIVRPGVPAWLQITIETALAKVPADRFRSAADFGRALRAGESGVKPVRRRSRWLGFGALLLVAAVAAGGFLLWRKLRGPLLDPQLYAVVPFIHLEGVSSHQLINGANCATLASEALRRWRDLGRVDGLRMTDLIERRGAQPTNLTGAVALARASGAGRLIWGELRIHGDSTVVRGVLVDTRSADPIRDSQITFPSAGNDSIPLLFATMVDALVAEGQPPPSRGSAQPFAAVQAFAAGMAARNDWDLVGALREFRRALAADPSYPAGNLRVAEVSQWLGENPADWRATAAVAAASSEGLSAQERLHAAALVDFADQRYPESCGRYRELVRRDSSDFAAWYGLGECQRRDRLVEADRASASGWRFRSSYESAAQAYLKALGIVPSAHRASQELMLRGLLESLVTTPGEFRPGERGASDPRQFGAFPVLVSDTLAFVPYPLDSLAARREGFPVAAALERDGRILDDLTRHLVAILPNSASAWGARAGVLERAGLLQPTREESALESIRRARGLAAADASRLSFALAEIRIRLKLDEFAIARTLADSALRRWADVTGDQAMQLAPFAGLLGKWRTMVGLTDVGAGGSAFIGPAGEVFRPPASLARPALRLLVHAALGGPRDSLEVLEVRLARGAAAWPDPQERAALTMALLANPAQLGFPTFGLRPIHDPRKSGPFLLTLQTLLVRSDSAGLRRRLADLDSLRHNAAVQTSQLGLDAVYQEAWLRLGLGDSASAAGTLDDALESLPLQRSLLFRQLHGPASLVYAMALRAQLAAKQHDPQRARRWALAVVELWRDADPGLALDLRAMKALAGTQ